MKPLVEAWPTYVQGQKPMSSWSWLGAAPESCSRSFRQVWVDLLEASADPFAIYQSPEWFDVERGEAAGGGLPSLAIRRDRNRQVVGVVPLYSFEERCVFPLALGRGHLTRPKKMIHIPSGRLLLPDGDRWFDGLFASLAERRAERRIVKVSRVPVPSPLHTYIENSAALRRRYCVYVVPGINRIHTIPLPPSYDEFLACYSSKKRYNLRRQLRRLEQHATGGLELRQVVAADEVPRFLELWDQLWATQGKTNMMRLTPAQREPRCRRVAQAGLFRSYVLMDGSRPIAAFLGHLYGSTFMLLQTVHDPAYNDHSPGSCLHHMIVEDLISTRSARLINLGYGGPTYDHRSTNVILDYASYWMFPAGWKNRLFQIGYQGFRWGVSTVRARWGPFTKTRVEVGGEAHER